MMNLKNSPPIVVEQDNTVISKLRINCADGFAITVKANGVVIEECDIQGCINLYGEVSNITIRNNYIHDIKIGDNAKINMQKAGVTTTEGDAFGENPFKQKLGAHSISIIGNYFENCTSGAYLVGTKGNILFYGNYSKNPFGPFPRGQMIQIAKSTVEKGPIIVENNVSFVDSDDLMQKSYAENGRRGVEDHINFYATSGTEKQPIVIRGNDIKGCSASTSGSGIMLGDGGGSHYLVENNRIIATGNAGIGLCGGKGWYVKGNIIYQNPEGTQRDGRGLQIERYGSQFEPPVIVEDNRVFWRCGKRRKSDASLFCSIDMVEFKNNIFSKEDVFEGLLEDFANSPKGAVDGLIRPWEKQNN